MKKKNKDKIRVKTELKPLKFHSFVRKRKKGKKLCDHKHAVEMDVSRDHQDLIKINFWMRETK